MLPVSIFQLFVTHLHIFVMMLVAEGIILSGSNLLFMTFLPMAGIQGAKPVDLGRNLAVRGSLFERQGNFEHILCKAFKITETRSTDFF